MIKTLLLAVAFLAAPVKSERDYQRVWCAEQGGVMEVTLQDRTRVDCLTTTHAVEVEFARNWKYAIGQALHYADLTERYPGIVLIVGSGDERHLAALERLLERRCLYIKVWAVKR